MGLVNSTRWPILLYACTGFTGLLIEQGFERYLLLLVGVTVSASSAVIFAYFLGFALGGFAMAMLQKRSHISRPLVWYGVIELAVGISAILFTYRFHPLLEWLAPLQGALRDPFAKAMMRFLFGCAFVLPTAALMGASFPLMAQVVDRKGRSGGSLWAEAYASNLIGAIAAAVLGPYLIYPAIGVRGAFWLSFALCAVVFGVAVALDFAGVGERTPPQARIAEPSAGKGAIGRGGWLLVGAAFASGLIIFALEVLWTHLIGMVLGCSVYAFSAMLLMVLLGLFIGASKTVGQLRRREPVNSPKLLQNSALLLLIQFIGWGVASGFFAFTPLRIFQNFTSAEGWRLCVAAILILPSSSQLGAVFPSLLGSSELQKSEDRVFMVGYMNAANAIGCQAGVLLALFVLIPGLGSELSLKLIIVALVIVSFLFLERGARPTALGHWAVAALLILVPCALWHWDPFRLDSSLGVTFGTPRQSSAASTPGTAGGAAVSPPRMVYSRESAQSGITTVMEWESHEPPYRRVRTLLTNGKFEGDDDVYGQWDAQFGEGTLSSIFVNRLDRALLIGLGTGHTALALKQVGYQDIDVAEFSPAIIDAARTCFAHLNKRVLADPAVHVIQEDGRNVLITAANRRYDMITLEITSIWFAGATNVYSIEFYREAREHLVPQGALQQWVQLHHIGPAEIASALATARAVFPYVSFWRFGNQGYLIATNEPQRVTPARHARLLSALSVPSQDRREPSEHLLDRMLASRLLSPAAVDRVIADMHPRLNTDHNRYLEYATPRYYATDHDWTSSNVVFFAGFESATSSPAHAPSGLPPRTGALSTEP